MGGVVNIFKARVSVRGNVDKLEEWDNMNLLEFS